MMKGGFNIYKVTGWTCSDDDCYVHVNGTFLMDSNPPELNMRAIRDAIISEVRDKEYQFTGSYHQYGEYGTPIINDKYIIEYSQRSWGGIMADALGLPNNDGFAYVKWAWIIPEGEQQVIPEVER